MNKNNKKNKIKKINLKLIQLFYYFMLNVLFKNFWQFR